MTGRRSGRASPSRSPAEFNVILGWADRIRAQPWQEAFVFFKHEDEGQAPAMAARLRELVRE